MSFAEAFSRCMQGGGISFDPGAVPDKEHFKASVEYLKSWRDGLDEDTKEGIDEASMENDRFAVHFEEAGIANGLSDALRAFDGAVGYPLSTLLDWCAYCIEQADQPSEPSTETS